MKSFGSKEIRSVFLDFFSKKDHKIIESSSLIPADPTVLFTSAGMQQFIPYLSGRAEPPFHRAASVQKCFRTSDIDSVGDESHLTFFEMLGNWSFNDYFKEEAVHLALELLINEYQLEKEKLWVTVFSGGNNLPRDKAVIKIWQDNGIPEEKIKEFGLKDNFWGPVAGSGPCGPCSEIHYDQGEEYRRDKCTIDGCGPNCGCGKFVEIWNLVFMEYNKSIDGKFERLPVKNIDTGAGLERITAVLQKTKSIFETDLFLPIIKNIEELSKKNYKGAEKPFRIIADHARAACFLIADEILPSKEDKGYVLRRIIRRAIRYGNLLKMPKNFLPQLALIIIDQHKEIYSELKKNKNEILTVIQSEEEKFEKTLERGLGQLEKLLKLKIKIEGNDIFYLYETFGFPLELIQELAQERGVMVNMQGFYEAQKKHQEISRAGAKQKFGGHGLEKILNNESGIMMIKLHTATHLLHTALRQVLGKHIQQAGSDINPERLRFDFTHGGKLSDKEIKMIEGLVNEKIKENLPVKVEEMLHEEAIKSGALAFFKERYPKNVKVYSVGSFSKEICAGPHVQNTSELGIFKIIKEESSGAGARRIKAILN